MSAPSPVRILILSVALLLCVSSAADAQINRLKKAAADAAERETANQVDRMVTEAVQCAFDDPRCVEEAEKSGKPVVLIDSEGRVITDDEGRPVTDPDAAAAQAGGGGEAADPTKPGDMFDSFFDEREYFTHAEVGWTASKDRIYLDNVHLTYWHAGHREAAQTIGEAPPRTRSRTKAARSMIEP